MLLVRPISVCTLFTDTENRIYFRNKFSFLLLQDVNSDPFAFY